MTFPTNSEIARAAARIREGGLVAFPTETVYGLGANALDATAVERIYAAKGRPETSPLIVHIDSVAMALRLTAEWPAAAGALASRFWPGALTLVVPKLPIVPDRVTAGLPSVGLRVPAHPVALALIQEAGVPIAAPSANRFTQLSPTTAEHVRQAFAGQEVFVLDGGPCQVGIESTVLSLAGDRAILLRPGMVTQAEIEAVIGPVELLVQTGVDGAHASPGLHARHYSPRTPVCFLAGTLPAGRVGVVGFAQAPVGAVRSISLPGEPAGYAAGLYAALHELDQAGLDWIAIERPPDGPEWAAIHDRLRRATAIRT